MTENGSSFSPVENLTSESENALKPPLSAQKEDGNQINAAKQEPLDNNVASTAATVHEDPVDDPLTRPPPPPTPRESLDIHEEHFVLKSERRTPSTSINSPRGSFDLSPPKVATGITNSYQPSSDSVQSAPASSTADPSIEDPLMRELDRIAATNAKNGPQRALKPQLKSETTGSNNSTMEGDSEAQKRRVTFPEDDKLVLGYMEPHYHWNHAPSCTTDELIGAYRQACAKNRVNPIPILLEQLKGIDPAICNERYETLNLRGVKLTTRDVEALEQVFRRVQVQTLDFDNCNLDDETGSSLFDMIEYYESCTKLNISANPRIGARGLQSCSRMIKRTPCLEGLMLRNTMFVDTSMPALGRALRAGCVNLRQLHLDHCNVCGRNLLILVSALKMNESLRELHLTSNNLMPTDGIQLGALLKFNRSLRLLDLRNNSLGDVGTCHLCDGLFEQSAPDPTVSMLPGNNLNPVEGVTPILPTSEEILAESRNAAGANGGLEVLILWNNAITHVAMVAMAEALRRCAYLRTLNLGCNNLGGQGAHALKEGLLCNRSLMRLFLPACKINCEGAVALAEYIADTKQLQRMDLRENDIRTAGLMALSHALRLNESVSRIDLDKEPKKEPHMKDYAQNQRYFLDRLEVSLRENRERAQKRMAEEAERLALEAEVLEEDADETSPVDTSPQSDGITPTTQSSPILSRPVCLGVDLVASLSTNTPPEEGDVAAGDDNSTTSSFNTACLHSPTDEILLTSVDPGESGFLETLSDSTMVTTDESADLQGGLGEVEEQLDAEIAALPLSQRLKHIREQRHHHHQHKDPQCEEKILEEDILDAVEDEEDVDVMNDDVELEVSLVKRKPHVPMEENVPSLPPEVTNMEPPPPSTSMPDPTATMQDQCANDEDNDSRSLDTRVL